MTDLIVICGVVVATCLMCALGAVMPWDDGGTCDNPLMWKDDCDE